MASICVVHKVGGRRSEMRFQLMLGQQLQGQQGSTVCSALPLIRLGLDVDSIGREDDQWR